MKVLIIGTGGCGVNWISSMCDLKLKDNDEVELMVVDGSESNIRGHNLDGVTAWVCPDTDGGGMRRGTNVAPYKRFINSRIHELPDADLYIVAFSATGGSGSVLAPELILHLLNEGKSVIGVTVTSTASKDATRNSNNVLRGLAAYSKQAGKPIVARILNGDSVTASEVDADCVAFVEAIVYATSSKHLGLDTSDLSGFLDYTSHGVDPGLTELMLKTSLDTMRADTGSYLTTLSVLPSVNDEHPNVDELTNYRAIGGTIPLYFGTRIDNIGAIMKHIGARNDHYNKLAKSHAITSEVAEDEVMEY